MNISPLPPHQTPPPQNVTPPPPMHAGMPQRLKQALGILNRISDANFDPLCGALCSELLPELCHHAEEVERFVDLFVQKGCSEKLFTVTYARLCFRLLQSPFRVIAMNIIHRLRELLVQHRTIPHTVFFAQMYVAHVVVDGDACAFVRHLMESDTEYDAERLVHFLRVARTHFESRNTAYAIQVNAYLKTQGERYSRISGMIRTQLEGTDVIPTARILADCPTLQARRETAVLLLNQALQGTANSSYASCRRGIDKYCAHHKLDPQDQTMLQQYLSEYLLAGNTFSAVPAETALTGSLESPKSAKMILSQAPVCFHITDRVRVSRVTGEENSGLVKYIGTPHFDYKGAEYGGVWLGVALDAPKGNHDGCVDGVRYFHCWKGHGVFVRPENATLIEDAAGDPVFLYPQDKTQVLLRFDIRTQSTKKYEGFTHGDRIATPDGNSKGTVIGTRYGILFWHMDGADGASPCRDNANEALQIIKKKKYKVVGHVTLRNYITAPKTDPFEEGASATPKQWSTTTTATGASSNGSGSRKKFGTLWSLLRKEAPAEVTKDRVRHLVTDNDPLGGALQSPSLASYYSTRTPRTPLTPTSTIGHSELS